ncbi:RES domain-containing protein [Cryobacterium suzukii]|uniref:RES domain-containing protein n=1 Tax=Cryobacterium suzukii TaxID=1259198 RepID=A0A4V3ISB9_9MICO|nr:RES domain-containing protein [Cryobacterium suzukii]
MEQVGDVWSSVSGSFYRAVNPAYKDAALLGSRLAGRYSEPNQRTLYLSSSPEGVDAAMSAHTQGRVDELVLLKFHVEANNIVDLRDPAILLVAGVNLADAVAPWQDIANKGGEPSSWNVRRRLESLGATGLIDPSRKRPGLWHLTLFRWNSADAPRVALA